VPDGSTRVEYRPLTSVAMRTSIFASLPATVTTASGIAAPLGSVTIPEIRDGPVASAPEINANANNRTRTQPSSTIDRCSTVSRPSVFVFVPQRDGADRPGQRTTRSISNRTCTVFDRRAGLRNKLRTAGRSAPSLLRHEDKDDAWKQCCIVDGEDG